jgi:hypothetical protein
MPIFGVLFSILLLGEHISWYHWVGFTLTLLGIFLLVKLRGQVLAQANLKLKIIEEVQNPCAFIFQSIQDYSDNRIKL